MTTNEKPAPGEPPEAGTSNVNSSRDNTSKPERLPWENEPHVNREAATTRAIAAAQPPRSNPNSAVVVSYAQKAFDDEVQRVAAEVKGARNGTLFKAAANLFELVAARALDEQTVVDALHDACLTNGSIRDDGESQFEKTIQSARRRGFDNPRDLSGVGLGGRAGDVFAAESDDEPKQLVLDDFRRLERGFWTERESLETIYLAALAGMAAPWAVLAHCAAIALAQVRPRITLPPLGTIRGSGGGSLNWLALIVDASGGGKDLARSVAEELVPIPDSIPVANVGSGEGLIDAYAKPKTEADAGGGVYESITVECNEIDALTVLGNRAGSTLLTVLRSAFSGERLSFTYLSAKNRPQLRRHTYRMTVTISAQPKQCGALLADANGGTPQRFQWFPANDRRIDSQPPPWPGALTLPSPSSWLYPKQIPVPYEAIELIREERVRNVRGDGDALDSHALFVRLKFAFALAVLDGRDTITSDDWRLGGVAMRVSDHVRAYATQQVELAAATDAEKRGTERGIEHDAANDERDRRAHKRRRRIADLILSKLKAAGVNGMTQGQLTQSFAHRDRWLVESTLLTMEKNGEAERREPQVGRTTQWVAPRQSR